MSNTFVVNPYTITYEAIANSLRLMIANDPTTFTDFFNDGSGSTVVDVAAALGAFFAYHIIAQRKEFTLEQATSYKSLIGNAYDKGYNVSRGNNLKLKLSVTPSNTGSLMPWTTIGTVGEYDVILVNPATFTKGINTTIDVVIGNRGIESKTITTSKAALFRFTSDDMTNDLRLFLDGEEITYSTSIADLLNDYYLVLSNSYGSVNVFYLNTGANKYNVGSTLTIDYIKRNTVDETKISASDIYLEEFTLNDMETLTIRSSIESKYSIRLNAALHAETQGVIKARADFKKVLKELDRTIKSINDKDIQPGRISIVVLKDDYTPLTESDKLRYKDLISKNTVSGVANTYYQDARKYEIPLEIVITPYDIATTPTTLLEQVKSTLESHEGVLATTINFDDIENAIEQEISGVKVARINAETSAWKKGTYRQGALCIANNFNGKSYYVDKINFLTGTSEPNWDSKEDGYVVDNAILWKEYVGTPNGIMVWKPQVPITLGTLCADTFDTQKRVFEAVGYVARTGSTEPDWSTGSQVITDNNIIWTHVDSAIPNITWSANKLLQIGQTLEKKYTTGNTQTYVDKTVYTYYGEVFGSTFYTKVPLANSVECYSDEETSISIGVASNFNASNNTVTITPSVGAAKTGSFVDSTVFHYTGGIDGDFYCNTILKVGTLCYRDRNLQNLFGEVTNVVTSTKTVTIIDMSKTQIYYYRVADYAIPTGDVEPNWSVKTLDGYVEDGARLLWRETTYPARFLSLGEDSYAKFIPEIKIG